MPAIPSPVDGISLRYDSYSRFVVMGSVASLT